MTVTISVLNQKGGVGKTTLSTGLASVLSEAGYTVLLIDADPQGSSLLWKNARKEASLFPVVGIPHDQLNKEVTALGQAYDFVIIDGPPSLSKVSLSAIMASEMVLIPVQPSPYDIWAAEDISEQVTQGQTVKPMLKCAFVINRKIPNTVIGRAVVERLKQYPHPTLQSSLTQRVIFAEAANEGKTLSEIDKEGVGTKELESVVAEALIFLTSGKTAGELDAIDEENGNDKANNDGQQA
jgi:chromosome partitioning protein